MSWPGMGSDSHRGQTLEKQRDTKLQCGHGDIHDVVIIGSAINARYCFLMSERIKEELKIIKK